GSVDLLLCMTVNPGWGGQAFIPRSLDKLRRLRALAGPELAIEADGGVDVRTAADVTAAGATHLVAGSAIFGAADPAGAYRAIAAAGEVGEEARLHGLEEHERRPGDEEHVEREAGERRVRRGGGDDEHRAADEPLLGELDREGGAGEGGLAAQRRAGPRLVWDP